MIGKAVAAVKKLLDGSGHDRTPQNSHRSHDSQSRGNTNMMGMEHFAGQAHHDRSLLPYLGQDAPYYGEGPGPSSNLNHLEARYQWGTEDQSRSFPYGYKGDRSSQKVPLSMKGGDFAPEPESAYDQQQHGMGQTLEELENSFVQETMQLSKDISDAEDKENSRHREAIRDIQERYQQKMATLRTQQRKHREEFLRQEAQFRQQQYQEYQQPAQAGAKLYDYEKGMPGGLSSSAREQHGYGNSPADRNDMLGGSYSYYWGEGYHNSSNAYRNSGYESGMLHSRNQGYDAAPSEY